MTTTSNVLAFVGPSHNADGQESVNHNMHQAALRGRTNDFGRAMIGMLTAWEKYAEAHETRYEDKIGSDYVIGRYWAETGLAIKRLLDGETGGLDCGSLAHNIVAAIEAQGLKTNDGYTLDDA